MAATTVQGAAAASRYLREFYGNDKLAHPQTIRKAVHNGELECRSWNEQKGRTAGRYNFEKKALRDWAVHLYG